MKPEIVLLALLCATGTVAAAEKVDPGERICVPSEDGRSWECGTRDAPPPERGLPENRPTGPSPEPPPFLMDPRRAEGATATPATSPATAAEAPPPDAFDAPAAEPAVAAPAEAEAAPVAEVAAEPVVAPAPEPAPVAPEASAMEEATAIAAPADSSAVTSEPLEEPVAEVAAEPAFEPAAPSEPAVAAEPTAPAPDAVFVDAEPERTEVASPPAQVEPISEPEPVPSPTSIASPAAPPLDARAFLALGATRHTVQLARAADASGFADLLARLQLQPGSAYAVPLAAGGQTWWLLLWGDFADAAAAREALALLPRGVLANAWPRRVAPLQQELRDAGR